VNPPAGIESEEIILATRGDSTADPSAVGIWDREPSSFPQDLQNLLSAVFSVEHFGHRIITVSQDLANATDYREFMPGSKASLTGVKDLSGGLSSGFLLSPTTTAPYN
jgi:hypothetical protein